MGSYMMHICVGEIIKKKYGFSDKFIYGSILPDIKKQILNNRNDTHYIEQVVIGGKKRNLPNIYKAIQEVDFKDLEINLGYISHLVEDYLWLNKYIPSFSSVYEDKVQSNIENRVYLLKEWSGIIYKEYGYINTYLLQKIRNG